MPVTPDHERRRAQFALHHGAGEVGIEITPILAESSLEARFIARLYALLRRTCQNARALTGAWERVSTGPF